MRLTTEQTINSFAAWLAKKAAEHPIENSRALSMMLDDVTRVSRAALRDLEKGLGK
jgi:hypothetical protein